MKVKVTNPTVVKIDGKWVPFMGEVDVDDKVAARLVAAGAKPVDGQPSPVEVKVPAAPKRQAPAPEKKKPAETAD